MVFQIELMQPKLLELHFSQLQAQWSNSKYNSYSDVRKAAYHKKLSNIIEKLEAENFAAFSETEIAQRYYVIFFIFKSLEFLNNSTTSTIPFEIVNVLEEALNDWSSTEDYIIVTSLVNNMVGYSFDNSLMFFDFIYRDIELLYGETFDKKLVQINLPQSAARDYLANVVLYHELGHFIDREYEITRVVYIELLSDLETGLTSPDSDEIYTLFPYLNNPDVVADFKGNYHPFNLLANHIAEYFCDLFASQYINDCSSQYLTYITLEQKNHSSTHPSTINRVDFVNKHLKGASSYFLDKMKSVITNITGKKIESRSIQIKSKNFENLIPYEISDRAELHSLFIYGWKVWLNDWEEIEKEANLNFKLDQASVYNIINNLIEKSIGNYIVKKQWDTFK